MPTIAAQVAPQRSTQYSALADALAPHELRLSPLGGAMSPIETRQLGGQVYLQFEMPSDLDDQQRRELGMLAMTHAFFTVYEQVGDHAGPFLRPLDTRFEPRLPPDLVTTRRYRGKTNELFTHFLCNVARFSSEFAHCPWEQLRVFDPLAGGGTTLFTALVLGADAAGVEKSAKDAQTTAAYLRRFTRERGIACQVKEERLKKLGRRWWFRIGKENPQQAVLANGDTAQSAELTAGLKKPHLIVADLPYGIQHFGALVDLLAGALPVWTSLLLPGGAMALAWESTRFPRAEMVALVERDGRLAVFNDAPYTLLAHRVDRVIKQRDVIVARRNS